MRRIVRRNVSNAVQIVSSEIQVNVDDYVS